MNDCSLPRRIPSSCSRMAAKIAALATALSLTILAPLFLGLFVKARFERFVAAREELAGLPVDEHHQRSGKPIADDGERRKPPSRFRPVSRQREQNPGNTEHSRANPLASRERTQPRAYREKRESQRVDPFRRAHGE